MSTTDDNERTVTGPPAGAAPRRRGAVEEPATGLMIERERGRAAGAAQPGHTLPFGTRLRDYEITGLIGEGGFGIVYLAWDHSLQRKVAIKEYMPSSMATRVSGSSTIVVKSERHLDTFKAGLKSFVNEARLLARFDHPSLVKVYRFWEENGTAYMVMPYYEGPTLKAALAELGHVPSESELRAWLKPLLNALTVMHAAQCYHRDIAPDNILLTPRGPLLLDFGAARRVIGDMTHAITVVLKPGYAPIEQYGDVASMSQGAWTDLYALACVVYYAITGKTPMSSVERLMDDRLEPLAVTLAGRYSPGFLGAIDAALAVRPGDRPQNEQQFRALLDADQPPSARSAQAPFDDAPASRWPDLAGASGKSYSSVPGTLTPELLTQLVARPSPPAEVVSPPQRAAEPSPQGASEPGEEPPSDVADTTVVQRAEFEPPSAAEAAQYSQPWLDEAGTTVAPSGEFAAAEARPTPSSVPIRRVLVATGFVAVAAAAGVWWLARDGVGPTAPAAAASAAAASAALTTPPVAASAAPLASSVSTPASTPSVPTPIVFEPVASAPEVSAPFASEPIVAEPGASAAMPVERARPVPATVPAATPASARPHREPPSARSETTAEPRPSPGRASTVTSRCSDILQKASLEPLTAEESAYLKRECR